MKRTVDILEPGTHTTIQDLGRPGLLGSGVSVGGAVDPISLRIANLLVGNPESAAAFECALVGPTLRFRSECIVALCGGKSAELPAAQAFRIRPRQSIRIGPLAQHAYAYLAISGGIDVPPVLGSRSTDVRARFGGCEGRRLIAGDEIAIHPVHDTCVAGLQANPSHWLGGTKPIRILPAGDSNQSERLWLDSTFRVSSKSNRMGIRLECKPIPSGNRANTESTIVLPGTIQLPPSGEPIVLLADAQTLGGYEQIGHVIAADLPRLAQCLPGTIIRFEAVTLEAAHRMLRQQIRELAFLRYALSLRR